jgi:hypothetical protein
MKRVLTFGAYASVVVLSLVALALFAALPALSLVTSLVYQGF